MCSKPFTRGLAQFGCGQCLPCRINRRRLWSHRLMLESAKHAHSAFVTLTYDDEHLPPGGTLVPKHAQDWLKRLRRALEPGRIRFFLVGEYGLETQRPHYHAAVFGLPSCLNSYPDSFWRSKCRCPSCALVRRTWNHEECGGNTDVGQLTPESASYIAGYVTKKLTNARDPRVQGILAGRAPEFSRMSLRPGIGAHAMEDVADALTTGHGIEVIVNGGDVPSALNHGSKTLPLGRYLRGVLRKAVGSEAVFKQVASETFALRMREMYEKEKAEAKKKNKEVSRHIVEKRAQKALNTESRYKIFGKKKGSL